MSDPGNCGTIVRIADWFGISSIVCSPGTVEMHSPKVVQASMGSIARVKLLSHDIKDFLKNFRDHYPISQVFATDLHGKNIYDMLDGSISFPSIIIMGSESHGISSEYEEFIDDRITIPSPSRSGQKAESLNVSVATGIVCALFFDRLRERSSAN